MSRPWCASPAGMSPVLLLPTAPATRVPTSRGPAAIATPGPAAAVDHGWRRGVVGTGLIDHRRRVSADAEKRQVDADVHPGKCRRCRRQRDGTEHEIYDSLLHDR